MLTRTMPRLILFWFGLLSYPLYVCSKPIPVVASTTDIASVAREIGVETISLSVVCRAGQDPHAVELLPDNWVEVKAAVVYLKVGAGLDLWADHLIKSAGSPSLRVIDCSAGIDLLETVESHGDHEHKLGNPHYWLGPSSLRQVAFTICAGLSSANPYGRFTYERNRDHFVSRLDSMIINWAARLAPCGSPSVITYHRTWDYFARDFGWTIAGTIEPQPGVEAGPADVGNLFTRIATSGVKYCLVEPYNSSPLIEMLEREAHVTTVALPTSAADGEEAGATFAFFEQIVNSFVALCAK